MPKKKVIKKSALVPTILIAQGTGFVGKHLTQRLLEKDARVIVLDNLTPEKKENVKSLLKHPKFGLFDVDINKGLPDEIKSVDYIIHLGNLEAPQIQLAANLDDLFTYTLGTKNLLDLAQKSEAKFLFTTSIETQYATKKLLEETYKKSEAEKFAQAIIWEYHKKYDTDIRVTHVARTYGPEMELHTNGILETQLRSLLQHKDLMVTGEGIEKQYYLYITDAVTGILRTLFGSHTKGKTYTIANKEPYSILETAFLLRNLATGPIQISYEPQTSPVAQIVPVLPENPTGLKWKPKITLREGLIKTLESFDYEINEHSFKPNKIIENKLKETSAPKESLSSLQGLIMFPSKESATKKHKRHFKLPNISLNISNPIKKVIEKLKTKANLPKDLIKPPKLPLIFGLTFLISFMLLFILLPIVETYTYSKIAVSKMEAIPQTLAKLQTEEARENANTAFKNFYRAYNVFRRLGWIFKLGGSEPTYLATLRLFKSAAYFSEAAYNTSKAINPFNNIWEILKPTSGDVFAPEQFTQMAISLEKARVALQFAQAEYKNIDKQAIPKKFERAINTYETALNTTQESIVLAGKIAPELPQLLGMDRKQKYLILLQNSNEMRPTGGFIGSYAILELEKGKISNLAIDDIYNPDGQIDLRNIVAPVPTPIQNFLKEDRLYLRNANWNPDFTKSAQTIEDLFFKVTGESFDGILALDLNFVENILNITGPIFLTAYNEEVTTKNIYEKTQFYSEFNYETGSSQKKSFLTLLGSKLMEKVFALSAEKIPALIATIGKTLAERHLLIYIPEGNTGILLNQNHWDGSLVQTENDYLYVVNANLGGTKANYFVTNELFYTVAALTRDGTLRSTLVLKYTHTGLKNTWPGGPYTNYVRVLTQRGTKLTGATVKQLGTEKDIFKDIVTTVEGKYTAFATDFTLESQDSIELVLNYDLPTQLALTKDMRTYNLYWQKQPGTRGDTIKFEFQPPFGLDVATATPEMKLNGDATLEGLLNIDKEIYLELR